MRGSNTFATISTKIGEVRILFNHFFYLKALRGFDIVCRFYCFVDSPSEAPQASIQSHVFHL